AQLRDRARRRAQLAEGRRGTPRGALQGRAEGAGEEAADPGQDVPGGREEGQGHARPPPQSAGPRLGAVAAGDLTTALLRRVSRSFYLSLAVLPRAVRPTIGLAYLFARASDTIADTRLIDRASRIAHLEAVRGALQDGAGDAVAAVVGATAGSQALPAERALLERLPECLAAFRALPSPDRARVRAVLSTIIE